MKICLKLLHIKISYQKLVFLNIVVWSVLSIMIIIKPNFLYVSMISTSKVQNYTTTKTTTQRGTTTKINIEMKYILLWTKSRFIPFSYMGKGNSVFVNKSCEWTNCYVTDDEKFLGSYTEFEVVAFNGPQIAMLKFTRGFPQQRSYRQKYVFANIESAANYPISSSQLNGYFNWTWTYKLDSDVVWGYIIVKDANNTIIGPRPDIKWLSIDHMEPIDDDLRKRLSLKKNAAAWFSSNCLTSSNRERFVKAVQKYLSYYNLTLDIYGDCGDHQCPKKIMSRCLRIIRKQYYFYFAFENSISEDYVTEKLLHGLNNNAVPVVYGGATYSRFMPDGIYLNARALGPKQLALKMYELINNPAEYEKYFRWKKYYSFHATNESPDTDPYCKFCAAINNQTLMRNLTIYKDFNHWWMRDVIEVI